MNFTVIDIETTGDLPWRGSLVAVGIGDTVYRPDEGMEAATALLADPSATVVCHTNYDLRWLVLNGAPLADGLKYHDTKVMAFMLDVLQELGLDPLAQKYLGLEKLKKPIRMVQKRVMYDCSQGFGFCPELGIIPIEDVPWEEMVAYNGQDLKVTADLYLHLQGLLEESGQWQFFLEEESPFSKLLVEMEEVGLPMDRPALEKMYAGVSVEREDLGVELVRDTGCSTFNLRSGDQVADFLYDEMPTFKVQIEVPELRDLMPRVSKGKCKLCGSTVTDGEHDDVSLEPCLGRSNMRKDAILAMLPQGVVVERLGNKYVYGTQTIEGRGLQPPKIKAKKGKVPKRPSIDAETLVLMHGRDPWVSKYLRWKSLNTLCTNYLEQWIDLEHAGRIHGRFDQARAETGRIVSRDPNLQAIPVTMEWDVRVLFQEPLIIGDYSGLDARMAAHFSEDPVMLDIFCNDRDLYGTLAAIAWGGEADKTNPNRSLMKILFLSAQYGAAAGSIGDKIRISGQPEKAAKAKQLLKEFEETLPRLFEWREEVLQEAKADGYITTIAGRRRYLPDLYERDWYRSARAERQCVASKVQGSSADLVRRTMLAAREKFPHSVCRMILQVHDEVLWQRGPEWKDEYLPELQHIMETGHEFDLNLPMRFPISMAESWSEKDAQGARSYVMRSAQ